MQQRSPIAVHVSYDQQDEEETVEKNCNDNDTTTTSSSEFAPPAASRFASQRIPARKRPLQECYFQSLDPSIRREEESRSRSRSRQTTTTTTTCHSNQYHHHSRSRSDFQKYQDVYSSSETKTSQQLLLPFEGIHAAIMSHHRQISHTPPALPPTPVQTTRASCSTSTKNRGATLSSPSPSSEQQYEQEQHDSHQHSQQHYGARRARQALLKSSLSYESQEPSCNASDGGGGASRCSSSASTNCIANELVTDANPNDVLCGRGGKINGHSGNRAFRSLVKQHQEMYLKAKKKMKPNVAASIVAIIRGYDPPGRFLKKDVATGAWYDIGDDRAREKTSQALREGAPEIKKISNIKHVGGKSRTGGSKRRAVQSPSGDENQVNGIGSSYSNSSGYNNNFDASTAEHQHQMQHTMMMSTMHGGYQQQPTSSLCGFVAPAGAGDDDDYSSSAFATMEHQQYEQDGDGAASMLSTPTTIYVKRALPYPIRRLDEAGAESSVSFESMSPEEKLQWKDFEPPRWSPISTTARSDRISTTVITARAVTVSAVKETTPTVNYSNAANHHHQGGEDRVHVAPPSANIFGSVAQV